MRALLLLLLSPLLPVPPGATPAAPAAPAALQVSEQVLQSLVPASGRMFSAGLVSLTGSCCDLPVVPLSQLGGRQPTRPALSNRELLRWYGVAGRQAVDD